MSKTVYNDTSLAHAYRMTYRLIRAIGMYPWQSKWVGIESRFYSVMRRKHPGENWEGIMTGIRMNE